MFVEIDGKRYTVPGDFARFEADGDITLLGRGNTCVNTGGEKVFPEEVEAALKSHPDVFDALVIGVPDELLGQRVGALDPAARGRRRRHCPNWTHTCASRSRATRCRGCCGWSTRSAARRAANPTTSGPSATWRNMRTSLCDELGIEHPVFGFTPSEHVAAAISRAGGLGVLGCVRFNDAADLDRALTWMDENTDGKPYGVDIVMPATVPTEGTQIDLDKLIPEGHRDFVQRTLLKLGVPPLPGR